MEGDGNLGKEKKSGGKNVKSHLDTKRGDWEITMRNVMVQKRNGRE